METLSEILKEMAARLRRKGYKPTTPQAVIAAARDIGSGPVRYVEPDGPIAGLRTAANPQFLGGLKYREQQLRAGTEFAHPDIVRFAQRLVLEARRYGVPLFPHEFYRSAARQAQLKADGFSRAGPGLSPHNSGLAVDVIHGVRAWDLSRHEWAAIGAMGKQVARSMGLKIVWGGDFRSIYDPAHWELENWRELAKGWDGTSWPK